jgi:hypothetical protein
VLLGAGASKDAGIPTTVEMTESIIERLDNPIHVRALDFIRYTLAAHAAAQRPSGSRLEFELRGEDDRPALDVERLFASVELLVDRFDQPWSPFVAAWSPGLESFAPAERVTESEIRSDLWRFENTLASTLNALRNAPSGRRPTTTSLGGRAVRSELASGLARIFQRLKPGDPGLILDALRERMVRSLIDVVKVESTSSVEYLKPLTQLASRQGSVTVATLNYDVTVETMAEASGMQCALGIEEWQASGRFKWTTSGISLMKLHGSIDWAIEEARESPLPLQRVSVRDPGAPESYRPAIVFGEGGKLRAEGPFLELLLDFHNALDESDRLLIVGYSFRDHHVNEMIARWFAGNAFRKIILLDPTSLDSRHNSFVSRLRLVNAKGRSEDNQPRRFDHVQTGAADGLEQAIHIAETVA